MLVLPKTRFFSNLKRGGKYNHNFYHQWKDRTYVNRGDYIFGAGGKGKGEKGGVMSRYPIMREVWKHVRDKDKDIEDRRIYIGSKNKMMEVYSRLCHINTLLQDSKEVQRLIEKEKEGYDLRSRAAYNSFLENIKELEHRQKKLGEALNDYRTNYKVGKDDNKLIDVALEHLSKKAPSPPRQAPKGPSIISIDEEEDEDEIGKEP